MECAEKTTFAHWTQMSYHCNQNSGFQGNRKLALTYNGENNVFTFSVVFYPILFILAGNEDMHKISD